MFKKLLIGFGAGFLFLIVLFSALGLFAWHKRGKYEETAVPYLKEAVQQISTWDESTARHYMSEEALANISEEDFTALIKWFSKLGSLQSMEEPTFNNVTSFVTGEGNYAVITYTVNARYDAGDAVLTVKLSDKGGRFEILGININSMALMQ
jgi:hypothetical protein